jgi:hypothetical protein
MFPLSRTPKWSKSSFQSTLPRFVNVEDLLELVCYLQKSNILETERAVRHNTLKLLGTET